MARYLTGRTRTLTIGGDLTADTQGSISRTYNEFGDIIASQDRLSSVSGTVTALGIAMAFQAGWGAEAITLGYREFVSGPGADDEEITTYGPIDPPIGGGTEVLNPGAANATGSWSVSVPVREYIEVTESGDPSPRDTPPVTAVRIWEEVNPDGPDPSWSISIGAASASGTASLSGDIGYDVSLGGDAFAAGYAATVTADNNFASAAETSSLSASGGSYSAGGDSISASAAGVVGETHTATAGLFVQRAREYSTDGRLRAMEDAYPDALTVEVNNPGTGPATMTSAGGSFSGSGSQRSYTAAGDVDGTPGTTKSKAEWLPLSFALRATGSNSLESYNEPTTQTRLLIRGKAWSAASIAQAASVTVDDGASLTPTGAWEGDWTGVGDVTPSIVSGAVAFSSVAGTGTLTRAFDDDVSLSGYRYLRVRLRSVGSADQGLRLTIGGKEWPLTTGADGTFVDRDIDLCAEPNETDTVSIADTKWPIDFAPSGLPSPSGDYLPLSEQPYFGVGRCESLLFENLASGVAYEIDSLTLRRDAYSRVTCLQTFNWWTTEFPSEDISASVTTTHESSRFLVGDTDGRQSIEEAAVRRQTTTGEFVSTTTYTHRSIKQLVDLVNLTNAAGSVTNPGWTMTDLLPAPGSGCSPTPPALPPAADCYYNSDRYAVYLRGGGAMVEGGTWAYGFDLDASTTLTLKAQPLYDSIEWRPDCGDVFGVGGGGSTGAIVLCPAAILRGQAHGLVLDASRDPESGVTVSAATLAAAARGSGASGSDGAFQTGLSYPRGEESITVTAEDGTEPSATIVFFARKRHRFVFVVQALGVGISLSVSATGRLVLADAVDGDIHLHFAQDFTATTWSDVNTGVAGSQPCVRYQWEDRSQRIWFTYIADGSGDVERRHTDSEGGSVSMPVTIDATWTRSAFDVSPTGLQYHYGLSGDAIEGKIVDRAGTVVKSGITAVASGVDDADFDVRFDRGAGRFYLVYSASGSRVTKTSVDGVTWS